MTKNQLNVLGEKLENCSLDPLTGWYRDGCCNTDENDIGTHTVCAKVNDDFLKFCKDNGNDLITPRPEYNFVGLKNGDSWLVIDPKGFIGDPAFEAADYLCNPIPELLQENQPREIIENRINICSAELDID